MRQFARSTRFARRLILAVVCLLLLGASSAIAAPPARGAEPIDEVASAWPERDREQVLPQGGPVPGAPPVITQPPAAPPPTPTATLPPPPTPVATPDDRLVGYDISYPQCGEEYPEAPAFAIVGVNGGRVYSANPCLGAVEEGESQLEWAGPDADLYVNTANPGPQLSRYWPAGVSAPVECQAGFFRDHDTRECAFVYGWNAAEAAHRVALDAFVSVGWAEPNADRLPGERTIWLDVEPANSWRGDKSLNVASLEGMVAYFESVGQESIGFYSTPRLWDRITGGTDRFAEYPAWHAGADDLADAQRRCAEEHAFTGGELLMVQWVEHGIDANYRCP